MRIRKQFGCYQPQHFFCFGGKLQAQIGDGWSQYYRLLIFHHGAYGHL